MSITNLLRSYNDNASDIDFVGGIFPRGFLSLVASKPGIGKSMLMQRFCCDISITAHKVWNGVGLLHQGLPLRSLYIAGETGSDILIKRARAAGWDYDPGKAKVISLMEALKENEALSLTESEGKKNLARLINECQPDIIVFDSVISFHDLNENEQKSITNIYKTLSRIAAIYNCAVVGVHHTRKKAPGYKENVDQDEVIGSSAATRLAALFLMLVGKTPDNQDIDKNKVMGEGYCVKTWGEKIPPFSFEIFSVVETLKLNINPNLFYKQAINYRAKRFFLNELDAQPFSVETLRVVAGIRNYIEAEAIVKEWEEFEYIVFDKKGPSGEALYKKYTH